MRNIEENLIRDLELLEGFTCSFYDKYNNVLDNTASKHVHSLIVWYHVGKNQEIKLPDEGDITFSWVMNQLEVKRRYKERAYIISNIIIDKHVSSLHATSYGIGLILNKDAKNVNTTYDVIDRYITKKYTNALVEHTKVDGYDIIKVEF